MLHSHFTGSQAAGPNIEPQALPVFSANMRTSVNDGCDACGFPGKACVSMFDVLDEQREQGCTIVEETRYSVRLWTFKACGGACMRSVCVCVCACRCELAAEPCSGPMRRQSRVAEPRGRAICRMPAVEACSRAMGMR